MPAPGMPTGAASATPGCRYLARVTGGTITVSDESTDVRFVDPVEFDRIPIHDTVRLRLHHHAERRDTPYLG